MVRRFDGDAWRTLELPTPITTPAPGLAVDDDGDAMLVWEDYDLPTGLLLGLHFDGSGWRELYSSSTIGIARSEALPYWPSVAMSEGRVCVAWMEPGASLTSWRSEVMLRCADRP